MKRLVEGLQRAAVRLAPQRDALAQAWAAELVAAGVGRSEAELYRQCTERLDVLLRRLDAGDVEAILGEDAARAAEGARHRDGLLPSARAIRLLGRCGARLLQDGAGENEPALAFTELAHHRLETLLAAQEEESARRLMELQEQAARAQERARELQRANEALRAAEARSQHRADQLALVAAVARRIAGVLDPHRLMQEAADAIQARMGHSYVAVVVLDADGVLVGRWAGKPGIGRVRSGPAQGPLAGVIGRAIRKRAPQAVPDVSADPDYHADVPGVRAELAVPLLDGDEAVGVIDFQSETAAAFDLDAVAAGEALADFLVVALRNARLFAEARRASAPGGGS